MFIEKRPSIKFWYIATILSLSILTVPFTSKAAHAQRSEAEVNKEMAGADKVLFNNAVFRAVKRVDPKEYARFRQLIRERLKNGATQHELEDATSEFCSQFMRKRLTHASPVAIKHFFQARLDLYEYIYSLSADALYPSLKTGKFALDKIPESSRAAFRKKMEEQASDDFANVVIAPSSDTPLRQDDKMVQERLRIIREKLTVSELLALSKEGQPDVDHAAYCQAIIHLYREALKLPEDEVVQLFRFLKQIQPDDRLPKPEGIRAI